MLRELKEDVEKVKKMMCEQNRNFKDKTKKRIKKYSGAENCSN